jgi:hypothetical protein
MFKSLVATIKDNPITFFVIAVLIAVLVYVVAFKGDSDSNKNTTSSIKSSARPGKCTIKSISRTTNPGIKVTFAGPSFWGIDADNKNFHGKQYNFYVYNKSDSTENNILKPEARHFYLGTCSAGTTSGTTSSTTLESTTSGTTNNTCFSFPTSDMATQQAAGCSEGGQVVIKFNMPRLLQGVEGGVGSCFEDEAFVAGKTYVFKVEAVNDNPDTNNNKSDKAEIDFPEPWEDFVIEKDNQIAIWNNDLCKINGGGLSCGDTVIVPETIDSDVTEVVSAGDWLCYLKDKSLIVQQGNKDSHAEILNTTIKYIAVSVEWGIGIGSGNRRVAAIRYDNGHVDFYSESAIGTGVTKIPSNGYVCKSLVSGKNHTCAITSNEVGNTQVVCWDSNGVEQQYLLNTSTYSYIAAGDEYTCGIKTGGELICRINNTSESIKVTGVDSDAVISKVFAGKGGWCVIEEKNNNINEVSCFKDGVSGNHDVAERTVNFPESIYAESSGNYAGFAAIGETTICAIDTTKQMIYCDDDLTGMTVMAASWTNDPTVTQITLDGDLSDLCVNGSWDSNTDRCDCGPYYSGIFCDTHITKYQPDGCMYQVNSDGTKATSSLKLHIDLTHLIADADAKFSADNTLLTEDEKTIRIWRFSEDSTGDKIYTDFIILDQDSTTGALSFPAGAGVFIDEGSVFEEVIVKPTLKDNKVCDSGSTIPNQQVGNGNKDFWKSTVSDDSWTSVGTLSQVGCSDEYDGDTCDNDEKENYLRKYCYDEYCKNDANCKAISFKYDEQTEVLCKTLTEICDEGTTNPKFSYVNKPTGNSSVNKYLIVSFTNNLSTIKNIRVKVGDYPWTNALEPPALDSTGTVNQDDSHCPVHIKPEVTTTTSSS